MNTIRSHAAIGFLIVALSAACGTKPNTQTNTKVRANSNKSYTLPSPGKIMAADGFRLDQVVGGDGHVVGIKIMAMDGQEEGPTFPCVCMSACAGSCTITGAGGSAECSGGCSNSERNSCGSCFFQPPPWGDDGTGASTATTGFNSNKPPVVKDQTPAPGPNPGTTGLNSNKPPVVKER